MDDATRRAYLQSAGLAAATGLAGCFGPIEGGSDGTSTGDGDGDGTGGDNPDAEAKDPHRIIGDWLTETEVGGRDDTYEGLEDWRDRETVTISVGASGNGGTFAFAPSAVAISAGTDVEWSWGEGSGPHNVTARPEEQLGTSAYAFRSGDPREGDGVEYTRTMNTRGVALYHCEEHLSRGMKGGITVE
jgi:halocyanin-like protein